MLREEIAQIVGYELDDPRLTMVTVTEVRVSDNLRDARVFVTVLGTETESVAALVALRHAAPYIRRQLGTALSLRHTPELHFGRDTVEEKGARVDELLRQIEKPWEEASVVSDGSEQGVAEKNKGERQYNETAKDEA